ncbi:MAG: aminopeptidase [Deltaproteobacteria bacterium]|nr:aminopeptidase [Deltaproteobacteria bacterium]
MAAKKKTKEIEKTLKLSPKPVWDVLTQKERKTALDFSKGYKKFLDAARTEREAVREIVTMAKAKGFSETPSKKPFKYLKINREKSIALAVIGKKPLTEGFRIVISHIDAPRLDLKQNPLYEDVDLALLRTHYYGGIKKYQWVAIPLAIHGTIIKKDGTKLNLVLGEDDKDPVFTICDLLPHLSHKTQDTKKLRDAIVGEKLTILVGSIPFPDEEAKERFKLNILDILNKRWGLVEEDFLSAEIEVVPAFKTRDVGFDESLIGGYGQDDRVCAYCSLQAILSVEKQPEWTSIALFLDKEEIGSDGNTGAKSTFLELVVSDLFRLQKKNPTSEALRQALFNAKALSADVNGAINPNYQDVHEKQNAARLGYGVCVTKFTGSGGKYNANDASAEYVGEIRRLFNENGVVWQMAELGKVDEGGGGTIAKYLAEYGMDMIDCGTVLLGMHSPFEISSKMDVYETFKAYKVFYIG